MIGKMRGREKVEVKKGGKRGRGGMGEVNAGWQGGDGEVEEGGELVKGQDGGRGEERSRGSTEQAVVGERL